MVAYCVEVVRDSAADDNEGRSALPQKLFGAIALTLIALACAWTLYANLFGTSYEDALPAPTITIVTAQPVAPTVAVMAVPKDAPKKRSLLTAPVFDIAFIDHKGFSERIVTAPVSKLMSATIGSDDTDRTASTAASSSSRS